MENEILESIKQQQKVYWAFLYRVLKFLISYFYIFIYILIFALSISFSLELLDYENINYLKACMFLLWIISLKLSLLMRNKN